MRAPFVSGPLAKAEAATRAAQKVASVRVGAFMAFPFRLDLRVRLARRARG